MRNPPWTGPVRRILDGDTFVWSPEGSPEILVTIRLAHVDAPEKGRVGWTNARDKLRSILHGQTVTLRKVTKPHRQVDRYGRWVCYVTVGTLDVGEFMLRTGAGRYWVHRHYAEKHTAYAAAEASARLNRRGVWSHQAKEPQP